MSTPHSKHPPHGQFHGSGRENGRSGRFLASPGLRRPVSPQLIGPHCSHRRIRSAGQRRAAVPNSKPRRGAQFHGGGHENGPLGRFLASHVLPGLVSPQLKGPPRSTRRILAAGQRRVAVVYSKARAFAQFHGGSAENFHSLDIAARVARKSQHGDRAPSRPVGDALETSLLGDVRVFSRAGFAKHRLRARCHREV